MTEYGRIHTDGSRSGGQPVPSEDCPKCERFGDDCGEHSPSWQELAAYWKVKAEQELAAFWKAEAERLHQPTQADTDAMESILWVDTIIDDKEAIAKAFARHRLEERAKIVAWLREQQISTEKLRDEMNRHTAGWHFADEHASSLEQSANAIEAGEHLK